MVVLARKRIYVHYEIRKFNKDQISESERMTNHVIKLSMVRVSVSVLFGTCVGLAPFRVTSTLLVAIVSITTSAVPAVCVYVHLCAY